MEIRVCGTSIFELWTLSEENIIVSVNIRLNIDRFTDKLAQRLSAPLVACFEIICYLQNAVNGASNVSKYQALFFASKWKHFYNPSEWNFLTTVNGGEERMTIVTSELALGWIFKYCRSQDLIHINAMVYGVFLSASRGYQVKAPSIRGRPHKLHLFSTRLGVGFIIAIQPSSQKEDPQIKQYLEALYKTSSRGKE